jgi:hypothetical protein
MIRSLGCFKGFCVATEALGRKAEAVELPYGTHFVAGIAVHYRVSADKWKAILMLVDAMDRNLPAVAVVAQLAFRTILAPMQIGVTVLALVGSIGEFEIGMAVAACHSCVASAKRKAGARMVKLDLALDHLPIRGGVTGGARHIELSVWTLSSRKRPFGLTMQGACRQEKQNRKKE